MQTLALIVAAFVAMEPLTAATHRWVMHGFGWILHRSHHRTLTTRFEGNDAFPVLFASIVCVALFVGFNVDGWGVAIPVGVGVTAYGAAYALVHDVYIHQRCRLFGDRRTDVLERLAAAHRLHHRFNQAPYGMLLPIVPRHIRRRAERVAATPAA